MKRLSVSFLLSGLLLFSVWIGATGARSANISQTEFTYNSARNTDTLNPVTNTYTHAVYFPAIFRQYTVPTWQQLGLKGVQVVSIAIAPDGTLYAGTSEQGLYRSLDSGATWLPANEGHSDQAGVGEIEIDPHDAQIVYITSNQGLSHFFISHDAGQSWIPGGAIAFVPQVLESVMMMPGRLFVADCPLDSGGGRVYRSEDSGLSWTMVITEQVLPTEIAPSSVSSNTVYVSTTRGLYRSTDGGSHWEQLTNGLPTGAFSDIVLHPTTPLTAYVGVDASIYKTTDGGDTWSLWGEMHPSSQLYEWIIDPYTPQTHYAVFEQAGIHISQDSGRHWQPLNNGLSAYIIYELAIDSSATHLYAGTTDGIWILRLMEVDGK